MNKSEKNLLGIVVPVFNRIENIKILIKSMERQTFQDYIIVFVDDQSNDGTIEFLKSKMKERFWEKRLLIIENKTHLFFHVAKSRNDACRMIQGRCKYIMLLDSDVLLLPTFIENQLNLLNDMTDIILLPRIDWLPKIRYEIIDRMINHNNWDYFGKLIPDGIPCLREGTFVGNDLRTVMSHPLFFYNDSNKVIPLDGNWVLTVCLIISEEAFWKVGGFDESFIGYGYEDIDFGLRCEKAGLKCIASNIVPGYHIWHAKDQTKGIAAQNQYNLGKLICKVGINEKFRNEIDYQYWWHYCYNRGASAYITDDGTYEVLDESNQHALKVNTVQDLKQLGFMPEKVPYAPNNTKEVTVNQMVHHLDHYIPELIMFSDIRDSLTVLFDIGDVLFQYCPQNAYLNTSDDVDLMMKKYYEIFIEKVNIEIEYVNDTSSIRKKLIANNHNSTNIINTFFDNWINTLQPSDPGIWNIINILKGFGLRIGVASNIAGDQFQLIKDKWDEMQLFDVSYISGKLGVRKNEDRFYSIIRKNECDRHIILIDDNCVNLNTAQNNGVLGIRFTKDLKKLWKDLLEVALFVWRK